MTRSLRAVAVVAPFAMLAALIAARSAPAPAVAIPRGRPVAPTLAGTLHPKPFIASVRGKGDALFEQRDGPVTAFFTAKGYTLDLAASKPGRGFALAWGVEGAREIAPRAEGELPGRISRFQGSDPSGWRPNEKTFTRLVYDGIQPGVSMLLEPKEHGLEYTLLVDAGREPNVRLFLDGPRSVELAPDGAALTVAVEGGALEESKLSAYQNTRDGRRPLQARFVDLRRSRAGFTYGIEVTGADPALPVVIDPTITWATYLGGTNPSVIEASRSLFLDSTGIYVAGTSRDTTYPTTVGAYDRTNDCCDPFNGQQNFEAVVSKLTLDGKSLLFSTFLGGRGSEQAYYVASDAAGNVYVAGSVDFANYGFPTTAGALKASADAGRCCGDVFVTKLNPTGSSLLYSTLYGGESLNPVGSKANTLGAAQLQPNGEMVIAGYSTATDLQVTPNAYDTTYNGGNDAFVARLNATGTALVYGTYLGSGGTDQAAAVTVAANGKVYVAGVTDSSSFPTTAGAYDRTFNDQSGHYDTFVARLDPAASPMTLDFSTFLGGKDHDFASGLALGATGDVLVSGTTYSTDFPLVGSFQPTQRYTDAYLARLSPDGASLTRSLIVGGSNQDSGAGVTLDAAGDVFLYGSTWSTDFKPTAGGVDTANNYADGFIAKYSPDLTEELFVALFGNSGYENLTRLAIDGASQDLVFVGDTNATDLPVTPGAYDTTPPPTGDYGDLYVARLAQDLTPPTGGVVRRDAIQGADRDWWFDTSSLGANWSGFTDPESVVRGYAVAFGTTPGASDVMPFKQVATATTYRGLGLTLTDGGTYYATVRAYNRDGAHADVSSAALKIDATPPVVNFVNDGNATADLDATTVAGELDAAWSIVDGESGIVKYRVGLGTCAKCDDVVPAADVAPSTSSLHFTSGAITSGRTYYVTVWAYNAAGNQQTSGFSVQSSDGIFIDADPPTADFVNDGPGADRRFQAAEGSVEGNWSFSDLSGISKYRAGVGTGSGKTDVVAFQDVGTATTATLTGAQIVDGSTYFVTVEATDGAGLKTVASSNGVTVDKSGPVVGTIVDGSGADVDYTATAGSIDAQWSFSDPESGVTGYEVGIGSAPGLDDVVAFSAFGTQTSGTVTDAAIAGGAKYYVTVRATNGAGGTTTASSDGFTVDTTDPVVGFVNEGGATDVDFQSTAGAIDVAWSFTDASPITKYEVGIGSAAGRDDVVGFVAAGTATSFTVTSAQLASGQTWYATVRATDAAGRTTVASGDGVYIDASAPVAVAVNDGVGADVATQTRATSLSANWSFTENESGIDHYRLGFGSAAGLDDVVAFHDVGTATSETAANLGLQSGKTYFATVTATNRAGASTTASSDGVLVDVDGPVGGLVSDGAGPDIDYQTSTSRIEASWSGFNDPESQVVAYAWAIGTAAGLADVRGFASTGAQTSATATGLTLAHGQKYFVTVRATNAAGLTTDVSSDGVTIDTTDPVAGVVEDGEDATDVDVQASKTALAAHWSAFVDPESPLTYAWAIGTSATDTSVQPFTGVGTQTSAKAAGLTLKSGTTYFVTVRATNGAGVSVTATSDGVKIDAGAPTAGTVSDGVGGDIDFQASTTELAANWNGFVDPDGNVLTYSWAIGSGPGTHDVKDFTSVGSALSAKADVLQLATGATYYVTVRAFDGVSTTEATSDGVTVDATPPAAGTVLDGEAGDDLQTQLSTGSVSAHWDGFTDGESDIAGYELALGTAAGATDVRDFTSVGKAKSASLEGLRLEVEKTYFVTVRATNGSGLTSVASSDGVTIESPPAPVDPNGNEGCGCGASSGTPLVSFALLAIAALRRRRATR